MPSLVRFVAGPDGDGNWALARMRIIGANTDGTHTLAGGIPTNESGWHAFAARVMPWSSAMSHRYETSMVRWA